MNKPRILVQIVFFNANKYFENPCIINHGFVVLNCRKRPRVKVKLKKCNYKNKLWLFPNN